MTGNVNALRKQRAFGKEFYVVAAREDNEILIRISFTME